MRRLEILAVREPARARAGSLDRVASTGECRLALLCPSDRVLRPAGDLYTLRTFLPQRPAFGFIPLRYGEDRRAILGRDNLRLTADEEERL
jgi:hypothetical protein